MTNKNDILRWSNQYYFHWKVIVVSIESQQITSKVKNNTFFASPRRAEVKRERKEEIRVEIVDGIINMAILRRASLEWILDGSTWEYEGVK